MSTAALPPRDTFDGSSDENTLQEGGDEAAAVGPWLALTALLTEPQERLWVAIMLRSGRFAGAVFQGEIFLRL